MGEKFNIRAYIKDLAIVSPEVVERAARRYNLPPIDLARIMAKQGLPNMAADFLSLDSSASNTQLAEIMFEAYKNGACNSLRFSRLMLKREPELALWAIHRAKIDIDKLVPLQEIINQPRKLLFLET